MKLSEIEPFEHPRIDLEQYPTPPSIAAHLLHIMSIHDDIEDAIIVDLGTGTGIFAIGSSFFRPQSIIGLDRDRNALLTARENERNLDPPVKIAWVLGDVLHDPLCIENAIVIMNPPFGAQQSNIHADRRFLEVTRRIGWVSYSFHNEGSRSFIESFAADNSGTITHAWEVEFDLKRQFEFHERDRSTFPAECYRIEWNRNG